jgi:dye decolorizing peroxidase
LASLAGAPLVGCAAAGSAPGTADAHGCATAPAVITATGAHQAGIATVPPSYARWLAFDLVAGSDRDAVRRLMTVWSDDIVRFTSARPSLTDIEPELATDPAALTITVGFGPDLFTKIGLEAARPTWLAPLPSFAVDRLESAWSDGDLIVQLCAEDQLVLAHAARLLVREATTFATPRWVQNGFRHRDASAQPGRTMRNLMGQVDGTRNISPTRDSDLLWVTGQPQWLVGGTSMIVRRIAMNLQTWDLLDRAGREASIGRRLSDGAPLTGDSERDLPDLEATDALGLPVIDTFAHIRRARSDNPRERFLRRGYNYDDPPAPGAVDNAVEQFVPIQRRLDELDLLNTWTTPIGSAVFAVPAGFEKGGYLAQSLLEA